MHRPNWGEERSSTPRRGRWSQVEIARFKELYGLRDDATIARELNRSVQSVRNMAETLFRRPPRSGPWDEEEVIELKRYLGATTEQVIARILGRTEQEVREQIQELGRGLQSGRWTQLEINDLKRLYGTRSDEDLSLIFGRTVDSIKRMAQRLCIAKDKAFLRRQSGGAQATRMPRWKKEELDVLRRMYPTQSNLEIAQRLDRSVKSVVSKAHNMGLKKDPARLREMGRENVSLRYTRRNNRESGA